MILKAALRAPRKAPLFRKRPLHPQRAQNAMYTKKSCTGINHEQSTLSRCDFNSGDHTHTSAKNKKRKITAGVWDYFRKLQVGAFAMNQCITCEKVCSIRSDTSTLAHRGREHGFESDPSQMALSTDLSVSQRSEISPRKSRDELLTTALVRWIVESTHAFCRVNDQLFCKFVFALDPSYKLSSRRTIRRLIDTEFDKTKDALKLMMNRTRDSFCHTRDSWSFRVYRGYLEVTMHLIDIQWCL